MAHSFSKFWEKLILLGVESHMGENTQQRIKLGNQISLVIMGLMAMVFIANSPRRIAEGNMLGFNQVRLFLIIIASASCLYLSYRGKTLGARMLLCASLLIFLFIAPLLLGTSSNTDLIWYSYACCILTILPFLLFNYRKYKRYIITFVLGMVVFSLFAIDLISLLSNQDLPSLEAVKGYGVLYRAAPAAVCAFIALGTYYQKTLTDLFERESEQANEDLKKQQEIIIEQQKAFEEQNHKLVEQQANIMAQRRKMEAKANDLEQVYQMLKQDAETAARLQNSLLPAPTSMGQHFTDFALYFKPKNIVSGDFYWMHSMNQDTCALVVADCTGHGVPGALMTMVGHQLLNKIVIAEGEQSPKKILEKLHKAVRKLLNQDEGNDRSGMDLALIRLQKLDEPSKYRVLFSGAKRPFWYSNHEGKIIEVAGSRKSIGGRDNPSRIFEECELELSEGNRIFLFSDGIADQNGQKHGKVGSRRLKSWLEQTQNLPLKDQRQSFSGTFESFVQGMPQRDDQLILILEL